MKETAKKVPTKKLVWGILRERFKVLNDIKLVLKLSMNDPLNHLGSIWYHSESLEIPLFSKPVSFLPFLTANRF